MIKAAEEAMGSGGTSDDGKNASCSHRFDKQVTLKYSISVVSLVALYIMDRC